MDSHDTHLQTHDSDIQSLKDLQKLLDEKLDKFMAEQQKANEEFRSQMEALRERMAQSGNLI